MASFDRVVIVHQEHGVFLGLFLGLAFYSRLDSAGQTMAPVFECEVQAQDFLKSWDENNGGHYFVPLCTTQDMAATVQELQSAGLGDMLGDMPIEELRTMAAMGNA